MDVGLVTVLLCIQILVRKKEVNSLTGGISSRLAMSSDIPLSVSDSNLSLYTVHQL